jgi:hypothetical protein
MAIAGRCENPECQNITEYGGISRNMGGISRNITIFSRNIRTGTSQYFPIAANATVYKHERLTT